MLTADVKARVEQEWNTGNFGRILGQRIPVRVLHKQNWARHVEPRPKPVQAA